MEKSIMKIRLAAAVSVSALAFVSIAAHAQSSSVTRAQVDAELAQLQAVGYIGEKVTFPNKLQAAQARIQAGRAGGNDGGGAYGNPTWGGAGK
jgi:Domain of unknown function (DUF4148)